MDVVCTVRYSGPSADSADNWANAAAPSGEMVNNQATKNACLDCEISWDQRRP